VLVTGAAGAVGRLGIQLARDIVGPKQEGSGAKVIAYGWKGEINEPFADVYIERPLKQEEPEDWVNKVAKDADIDVVFDTVGSEVLEKSLKIVKEDGIVITIGTPIPDLDNLRRLGIIRRGVKCHFFIVKENGGQLSEIADLVQQGRLKPEIGAIVEEMTEQSVRDGWELYDKSANGGVVIKVYGGSDTKI
jgi:NADPH2:quinone reductase